MVPEDGWQGFLIRAAGSAFGSETGTILRSQVLPAGSLRISSGTQLAGGKDAHLIYQYWPVAKLYHSATARRLVATLYHAVRHEK